MSRGPVPRAAGEDLHGARTLVLDVDLEAPPLEPLQLAEHEQARALVWRGDEPLGELMLDGRGDLTPPELIAEVERRLGRAGDRREPRESPGRLPLVTVAVCTRDRPHDLARCLDSLRAQADPPPHELLVVDNAPRGPETRELVARYPDVRYAVEPLAGLGFARNRALVEARGDVLAFLDDDGVAPSGWLRAVATVFAADPRVGVSSGPVIPVELETEAQELFELRGGFTQSFERLLLGAIPPARYRSRHWPLLAGAFGTGCNLAVRAETMRGLGGFDDALGPGTPTGGGDDHDIVYRVLAAGHLFAYEPATVVRHRHRRDLEGLASQLETWGRGTVAFLMKHAGAGSARRRAWLALAWLLVHQARRLVARARPGTGDRLPISLVLTEIGGCFRGLLAYRRSQRYVRRLRATPSRPGS